MPRAGTVLVCAWAGCSKRSDEPRFGRCRAVDGGIQSSLLKPVPHSNVLCDQHGRACGRAQPGQLPASAPSSVTDGLAVLLSAVTAAPPPSPPSLLQLSAAVPVMALVAPVPVIMALAMPDQPLPASRSHVQERRFGNDVTNSAVQQPARGSPNRHAYTGEKLKRLQAHYNKLPHGEKGAWLQRRGLDFAMMSKWGTQMKNRDALPKAKRLSLQRCRQKGGGRKAMLPQDMELDIKQWVVCQRRGVPPEHFSHVVTVTDLLVYASSVSGKSLSDGWLWGFMERHRLALRAVTTNKVSGTPDMQDVVHEFRYQHRELLSDPARQVNIVNMDETAIFYNMNHKRTVDFKGARTVAVHETKQPKCRVTVVVWVTAAGVVGPPLIVHSKPPPPGVCKTNRGQAARREREQLKNKPLRQVVHIPVYNAEHEDELVELEVDELEEDDQENDQRSVKRAAQRRERMVARHAATTFRDVVIYTCYNNKGWMTGELMERWLEHVFVPESNADNKGWRYLVMDNCGPHETDEVVAVMQRLQIRQIMLPPNCSNVLQPLDHSLNALIKFVYRLEHARWLRRELTQPTAPVADAATVPARGRKRKQAADSRTRAPTKEEVETRVATAVYALLPSHVQKCWQHTLNGPKQLQAAITGHDQHVKQNGEPKKIPPSPKRRKTKAVVATAAAPSQSSDMAESDEEADSADAADNDVQDETQPADDDLQVDLMDD